VSAGAAVALSLTWSCAPPRSGSDPGLAPVTASTPARADAFRRAKLWSSTPIEQMNLWVGPPGPAGFKFQAEVTCTFVEKPLRGHSAKFACDLGGGDVVKVKFGETNGEVYGEVAATRLLWALGFGADRMYPVRVSCRGCPGRLGGPQSASGTMRFDPAVIEREMPGAEFDDDPGWSWADLGSLDPTAGGASRQEVDALKLMAVFLQHTDNKVEQQRLLCLDEPRAKHAERCRRPFLMLNDVGLTFGAANFLNNNTLGGVNFRAWSNASIWDDAQHCVGNLARSFTGTLSYPRISEEGRQFLAALLARLSRRQIRDLFTVSRFDRRNPTGTSAARASIDDWVRAFEEKRDAISRARCV
jgi:hypothetical protein